jgi:hypothetical protein
LGGAYATPKKYRQPDHAIEPSEPTPPWQFAALGNVPRITVTVHLISILEMLRTRGVSALGDAVRLVGDDDNGRGGMSMMQVMASGIN